jgi:hypothetical protein
MGRKPDVKKAGWANIMLIAGDKPLAFFALAILVCEAILAAIAAGSDRDTRLVLSYGILFCLVLTLVLAFLLARKPPPEDVIDINSLKLSGNDYRLIKAISDTPNMPAGFYEEKLVSPNDSMTRRVEALVKEGFVRLQHDNVFTSELQLTTKGRNLATIISTIKTALGPD